MERFASPGTAALLRKRGGRCRQQEYLFPAGGIKGPPGRLEENFVSSPRRGIRLLPPTRWHRGRGLKVLSPIPPEPERWTPGYPGRIRSGSKEDGPRRRKQRPDNPDEKMCRSDGYSLAG